MTIPSKEAKLENGVATFKDFCPAGIFNRAQEIMIPEGISQDGDVRVRLADTNAYNLFLIKSLLLKLEINGQVISDIDHAYNNLLSHDDYQVMVKTVNEIITPKKKKK